MKYVILLFFIIGCMPEPKVVTDKNKNGWGNYKITVIDSCEYIVYDDGIFDQRVYGITHKGNCKFCKLRSNQTNK